MKIWKPTTNQNLSNSKSKLKIVFINLLFLFFCALAHRAQAANAFFDVTGATAGYGTVAGGSYSWDDPNWATATGGSSATAGFVAGSFAEFLGTNSYTVTVNNSESIAGFVENSGSGVGSTLTINAAGGGVLSLVSNTSLTVGLPVQGCFVAVGQKCVINAPITGSGGINQASFNGTSTNPELSLFGNNTYSGGTVLGSSGVRVNFNSNNSFGTGPIVINNTTAFVPLLGHGGTTITLANNFTNATGACTINFGADANTPVILNGSWALQTFTLGLRNNGDSTSPLTLNGPISGSGALTLSGNNAGTITFNGPNTYTSKTSIAGGSNIPGIGIVLSVGSLNRVSGGNPSSNLGAPVTVANGTIGIGSTSFANTLLYTGPGETSDRVIDLAGTTGGAILEADGTGPLVLTATNTATGAGAKTLTLQGSNTGANSIGKIVNSTLPTSVAKAQAGRWVLTGTNTYTGDTTINGGTLEISGSIGGNATVNSGALTLNNVSALPGSATLSAVSGSTANLNFSGTNIINALVIDGIAQVSGVWGPVGSSAPNQNAIFAGTGYIKALGKPAIIQQPVSGSVFPDATFTFTVGVADPAGLTYQWKFNGVNIANATDSSYTISPVEAPNAGIYSCGLTNAGGGTNTVNASLYVMGTNAYTQTVRGDNPISYWRLDETNGALAYDAIGGNIGQYVNASLKQSGYSLTDPDPAIGLVANTNAGRGFVMVTNSTPFGFLGIPAFTLEGWAYFTNLSGVQTLFSTFSLTGGHGWRFGVNGNSGLRFTSGTHQDADAPLSTPLTTGVWYHLACACDGTSYYFYLNGNLVTNITAFTGVDGLSQPLMLGCNPLSFTNTAAGDPLGEQLRGRLDEMAIYGGVLSDMQVSNHNYARYADAPTPVAALPVVIPPVNYESLTTTLQENAAGVNLNYQWYKVGSGLIPSGTNSSLALSPLHLSDAGQYYVVVSNNNGSTNSPTNSVAVLAIPTDASQLHLTNGLVLHLPFDNDYSDISGRSNNGTNVGATTFVNDGVVGGKALHYSTASGSTNYVTLGVRPDLQFGSSTDFTISYWVRQPNGSQYTNLPFFANEPVGSTTGWMFAPYATASTWGGWSEAIGSMTSPSAFTSFPDSGLINDGNWHHLIHSASRSANVITYLDGKQVDSQAIGFLGSITTTTPANIGQDSTGTYAVTADADIDDVAVWQRTMTQLEISGMYLGGISNHVSFAAPVIVPVALQVQQVSPGQWQIVWSGTGGTLQAASVVNGTYTNVPSASSPYPLPTGAAAQLFYRLKY
jgi:autotransporter-associated beta strand protein